jgi:hypothetical protein
MVAKLMPKIFTVEWKAIPSGGTGLIQFPIANAFDFPGFRSAPDARSYMSMT